MQTVIGQQLSHFRILEEIGAVGMGVGDRALEVRFNRVVANGIPA